MTTVFITDIPAPYRIEMYNTLAALMSDLEVWYFQKESKARTWKFDENGMSHQYWVAGGLYLRLGLYNLFINPGLILKIFREQPSRVILAAGWNDFDVVAIVILKRLGLLRSELSFWSEANYLTIGAQNDNILKHILRRFVYNACDGYQLISGEMTRKTLKLWRIKDCREIFFPNTISETLHSPSSDKDFRFSRETPVILIVARLTERYKGLINFFNSLTDEQFETVRFEIAGDGEDRRKLEEVIQSRQLQDKVKLLGNLEQGALTNAYVNADAFCLPSLSDASPLAVIEALRWGMPVLLSNRCGNHFEAVEEGVNGVTFDPMNLASVRTEFDKFICTRDSWREMGQHSSKIYERIFEKNTVLENFLAEMTSDPNS